MRGFMLMVGLAICGAAGADEVLIIDDQDDPDDAPPEPLLPHPPPEPRSAIPAVAIVSPHRRRLPGDPSPAVKPPPIPPAAAPSPGLLLCRKFGIKRSQQRIGSAICPVCGSLSLRRYCTGSGHHKRRILIHD